MATKKVAAKSVAVKKTVKGKNDAQLKADKKATQKASICDQLAHGASLLQICKSKDIPSYSVVMEWLLEDSVFAENYARAREAHADSVFDDLDNVSDQAVKAESAVEVAGLRLKADNMKWKLARMNAKKYGDRQQVDLNATIELKPEQVEAKLQRLIDKASAKA
jgi:hypothetical protein